MTQKNNKDSVMALDPFPDHRFTGAVFDCHGGPGHEQLLASVTFPYLTWREYEQRAAQMAQRIWNLALEVEDLGVLGWCVGFSGDQEELPHGGDHSIDGYHGPGHQVAREFEALLIRAQNGQVGKMDVARWNATPPA